MSKLSTNFRESVKLGDDPARQITALERAVKEAFARVERWLNEKAPEVPRSPFTTVFWAGPGQFDAVNCQVNVIEATEPFEFYLPPHEKDLLVIVVDGRGTASSNTITLKRSAGRGAIMGLSADYVINTDNGYAWLISNGPQQEANQENWFVIARG